MDKKQELVTTEVESIDNTLGQQIHVGDTIVIADAFRSGLKLAKAVVTKLLKEVYDPGVGALGTPYTFYTVHYLKEGAKRPASTSNVHKIIVIGGTNDRPR